MILSFLVKLSLHTVTCFISNSGIILSSLEVFPSSLEFILGSLVVPLKVTLVSIYSSRLCNLPYYCLRSYHCSLSSRLSLPGIFSVSLCCCLKSKLMSLLCILESVLSILSLSYDICLCSYHCSLSSRLSLPGIFSVSLCCLKSKLMSLLCILKSKLMSLLCILSLSYDICLCSLKVLSRVLSRLQLLT